MMDDFGSRDFGAHSGGTRPTPRGTSTGRQGRRDVHELVPVMPKHPLVIVVVLGAFLGQLAGCASGPQSGQALKWATENEAERARLEAEGFPQYLAGS
jgi:hypothetical protein